MAHSKFSEKPAFNENYRFLKCTCGQYLEFKSKREEKLKFDYILRIVQILLKTLKPLNLLEKDLTKQRWNVLGTSTVKSFTNNIYPVGEILLHCLKLKF